MVSRSSGPSDSAYEPTTESITTRRSDLAESLGKKRHYLGRLNWSVSRRELARGGTRLAFAISPIPPTPYRPSPPLDIEMMAPDLTLVVSFGFLEVPPSVLGLAVSALRYVCSSV